MSKQACTWGFPCTNRTGKCPVHDWIESSQHMKVWPRDLLCGVPIKDSCWTESPNNVTCDTCWKIIRKVRQDQSSRTDYVAY